MTPRTDRSSIVLVGKESAGKSMLVAALTGQRPYSANFGGSTVDCELYAGEHGTFVDTPGILRGSDMLTTQLALREVGEADTVLAVFQATHLEDDLDDLLGLLAGKRGALVVTYWDKVSDTEGAREGLRRLERSLGVTIVPVDSRAVTAEDRDRILAALAEPGTFVEPAIRQRVGWRIEPPATVLEHPKLGPWVALLLLLLPAVAAVTVANGIADQVDPLVERLLDPLTSGAAGLPGLLGAVLAGPYGLLTMGPLLLVWAVPTVAAYSLLFAAYKASGLLDRLTGAVDPFTRRLGLSGRDVLRVLMGYGCNVPAVVSTRGCSSCSRSTCVSAVAFGSACSYQLGATLAVFAAAGHPWLVVPFLLYLAVTTGIYVRLVAPSDARSATNLLLVRGRTFLAWPSPHAIWRDARQTLSHFMLRAVPIFLVIAAIASALDFVGVIERLGALVEPLMGVFNLPAGASLAVVLASVRKDGILLLAESGLVAELSALQILTGVYLAGVLLPCLVTAFTIGRELSARVLAMILLRQATAAAVFTAILAWGGALALYVLA